MTVREVNLKYDMPTVEVALRRMDTELSAARHTGQKLFKFIHGYGSTGTGGKIRGAVRRTLRERQGAGSVSFVLPGEDFGMFSADARQAADRYPALRQDRDWGRENDGITIVIL